MVAYKTRALMVAFNEEHRANYIAVAVGRECVSVCRVVV